MSEQSNTNGEGHSSHDDSLQPAWGDPAHQSPPIAADVSDLAERLRRGVPRDVWLDARIDQIPLWELSDYAQFLMVIGLCHWFGIHFDVDHEVAIDNLSTAFDEDRENASPRLPFSFGQFVGRLILQRFGSRVAAAGLNEAAARNPEHAHGAQPAEIYAVSDLAGYASHMKMAAQYSISEYDTDLSEAQVVGILRKHCLGFDKENRPFLDAARNERIFEEIVGSLAAAKVVSTTFQAPADECVIHSALVLRDVIARAPSVLHSCFGSGPCCLKLGTGYVIISGEVG